MTGEDGATPTAMIEVKYTTPEPDTPIELLKATLVTTVQGEHIEGAGSIILRWLPSPTIEYRVEVPPEVPVQATWSLFNGPERDLKLATTDHSGNGTCTAWGVSETEEFGNPLQRTLLGFVDEFTVGNPAPVSTVRFEVPNFPKYRALNIGVKDGTGFSFVPRMLVETDEWRLTMQGILGHETLIDKFGKAGAYGLTHVGEVQRTDGKAIPFEEVERLWKDLTWWLSMLRGERTGPVIVLGVHEGNIVWERWKIPVIEQWNGPLTWLPRTAPSAQDGSFPGGAAIFDYLRNLDQNSDEHRVIERAIGWYTQSVQAKDLDPAVITAQAGLELLSWLRLTSEVGLSEDGFNKLDAADRLRLALNYASIPLAVPDVATYLHAATRSGPGGMQELDGPGAITEMRNGLVHPKGSSRLGNSDIVFEGGRLAIHYLELLLLNRFGYIGDVVNRLNWQSQEAVPWTTNS